MCLEEPSVRRTGHLGRSSFEMCDFFEMFGKKKEKVCTAVVLSAGAYNADLKQCKEANV